MSRGPVPERQRSERPLTPRFRPAQVYKTPPCQTACPNCGDIRGWIGMVAQREKMGLSMDEAYRHAWEMITDVNPFPAVLGRVCPHPCEAHCNRGERDEALAINAMERFLGDWAISEDVRFSRLETASWPEWIGVVGAGPSGLSFAYQMARRGYRVTIYESRSWAGGMLRYGIPDYRLPPDVLDAEIERILDLGIELQLETRVGRDVSLDALRDRHAALYLGIGAQAGRRLGIEGEDGANVWTGTDYLARINCGETIDLGNRTVVVGGGNTAVDAARVARRGGTDVTILYRRSREEMPANDEEVKEALEEEVNLEVLASPVKIERNTDGDIVALVAQRMRLGEQDESGRRRPVPIPDSEYRLCADSLIAAVSQTPVLRGLEALDTDRNWLITGEGGVIEDGLLAGGDALGLGIAGNAIFHGRRAAENLHARLRNLAASQVQSEAVARIRPGITANSVVLDSKALAAAARPTKLLGPQRVAQGKREVTATISEDQFLAEVDRCFSCGSCFGCERCWMYCTAGCFTKLEEVGPGMYFSLSLDECEECGKCVEVCPCGFLEVF